MTVQNYRKALTGTLVVSAFLSGGGLQSAKANPLPVDSMADDLLPNQLAEVGITTASSITVSPETVIAETADLGYLVHQSTDNDSAAALSLSLQQPGTVKSDVFPAAFVVNAASSADESAVQNAQQNAQDVPVELAQLTDTVSPASEKIADSNLSNHSSTVIPPVSSAQGMDWSHIVNSSGTLNLDAAIVPTAPLSEMEADAEIAQNTSDTFSPSTEEEIRQRLLIDPNARVEPTSPRPVPSSSFLTPSAYGADWGDYYLGLAGAAGGNLRDVDGSASLGFGVGDAVRNVGLEVSASIISLDGFAEDGTVGFKIHKVFPEANNLAIAAGWSNPVKWGSANEDEEIFYGVATQRFALRPNRDNQMPLTVSAGVGTGTFRSTGAIAAGDNALNPFGSVSVRVIPQLALTSSWTGSGLGLAASAAPFDFPFIFTAGVSDLTDNTAEGTRFQGSVGYGFSF